MNFKFTECKIHTINLQNVMSQTDRRIMESKSTEHEIIGETIGSQKLGNFFLI